MRVILGQRTRLPGGHAVAFRLRWLCSLTMRASTRAGSRSPNSAAIAVRVSPRSTRAARLGPGLRWVEVTAVRGVKDAITILARTEHPLAAVGIADEDHERAVARLREPLERVGVTLVCRAGRMQAPPIDWAQDGIEICQRKGVKFVVQGEESLLEKLQVDGYHVNSSKLGLLKHRPVSNDLLFSASCHNQEELKQAEALDVDYAFLSPVQKTQSHPNAVTLGWREFGKLVSAVGYPIYALGGMKDDDLKSAREKGAQGILSSDV